MPCSTTANSYIIQVIPERENCPVLKDFPIQ
jgi:hypothetical protein